VASSKGPLAGIPAATARSSLNLGLWLAARPALERYAEGIQRRPSGITKQAISHLVGELKARGYVEQVPDSTDTRAKIVRLTKRGVALHAASAEVRLEL
jgi:hypothetical protein